MATSFKALVRPEKKRSDNTWNIIIRVTHNRASKYITENPGHTGNAKVITLSMGSLVKYMGRDVIDISEINAHNIRGWIAELSKTTVRACSQYPSALRAVFNRAKKEFNDEDAGIINIPQSPFQHVDIPSVPVVKKRALTKAKIRKLATLPYQVVTYNG